ncbi:alpha/beta hydrolase [Pseudoxanthomonas daejeonensis]|uniref:esterase/lipase family protein n=1 Tax=Pseudoxanthomonas daejeonensis TaxID=266062 RepID=UPI001F547EF6|nr:alpha/beta hydrolase [Pseudoxanthomonas daejeonensis]UNK56557.1 alpha/beta hydrolase [Pseudoxanthomonas daejeonensis]
MDGAPLRVLLLHGLWMPGLSMGWMARRLRREGFATSVFAYPGAMAGPRIVLPALSARLRQADAVVAHSLGGLMTLEALRRDGFPDVARVVCLGSPLCGSGAARGLRTHLATGWALGRAGALLRRGCMPWEGPAEVGVVAGTRAIGFGRWFARFDGPSDGTVAVAETRLAGLADHCLVDASHSGLLFSEAAASQAVHFLRQGRFGPDAAVPARMQARRPV